MDAADQQVAATAPQRARTVAVFTTLCLVAFVASLDITAITTALPTITRDLDSGADYIWIANAYTLASAAIQPCLGQISDIFGRRYPMLVMTSVFALGSGLCGGATSTEWMIAARVIQGIGAGGVLLLLEVIVSDLVPLKDRSLYIGIALSASAIGTAIGPLIGGLIVQHVSWRWVFYLNLPLSGTALLAMVLSLNLKHPADRTWRRALMRIDWVGSVLIIAASCALMYALVVGGVTYPWSSYQVLLPLIFGALGFIVFHVFEASRFCYHPIMPPRLFGNRTSLVASLLAFNAAMLMQWIVYFLTFFHESVRRRSTSTAGLDVMPFTACLIPSAILAGAFMSKTGFYRALHWVGFAIIAICLGVFSTWTASTTTAEWAVMECLVGVGQGALLTSVLPALQAALTDADTALATAAFAFLRSFGFVWGVAIPAVVFNSQVNRVVNLVQDENIRRQLVNGGAYALAGSSFLDGVSPTTERQVLQVYSEGLKLVWQVALAFSLLGFALVFLEKHIPLRTTLQGEFGLEESSEKPKGSVDQDKE